MFSKYTFRNEIFLVPDRNKQFVGRADELSRISELLKSSSRVAFVVGLRGIGKSQIVKEYAHSNKETYSIVCWIDSSIALQPQFAQIAHSLNEVYKDHDEGKIPLKTIESPNVSKAVLTKLRNIKKPWLMIFDDISNAEEVEKIIKTLSDAKSGHIIFTSKYDIEKESYIKVEKLKRIDSLKLLQNILNKCYSLDDLDYLANMLGDHPLGIVTASSYIRQIPSLTVASYIDLFKKNSLVFTRLEDREIISLKSDSYSGSIASIMKIVLEQIRKKSFYAYEFLLFIAFTDNKGITDKLITDWLNFNNLSEDLLHEIIYVLSSHFLIEKSHQHDVDFYQIHELLQDTIKNLLPPEEKESLLERARNFFLKYFQKDTFQVSEIMKNEPHIFSHAKRVYGELPIKTSIDIEFLAHLSHAALFYQGDVKFGKTLINKISSFIENPTAKIEGFVLARFLNTKGKTLYANDLDLAIELTEKAIIILRNECIHDFRATSELFLALVNNLVDYYLIQGRVREAKEACYSYNGSLKELKNRAYETIYYSFLALSEMYEGDYEKALQSINLSYKNIENGDLSETQYIFVLVNKAEILARMGNFVEALALVLKLKKDLHDIFQGEKTHLLLRNEIIEGYIHFKLGKMAVAEESIKNSIRKYEDLVNSSLKDPLQGFAHTVLGEIFYDLGNYNEAVYEFQIADKIYDTVLRVREFDDISYLYKKITLASLKNKKIDLMRYYFNKHLEIFGLNHKRTSELVSYFDEKGLSVPW